ncbi:helix-turn-helix domain-containing protein [Kitasatospora sp. NPDC101801]|uniref:helix-turn-helix domain-containing protein n=1 Tax=Kitasatospora sp. NPDC101801 TaxID=3364103 RepID=UPI0037F1B034
MSRSDEKPAAAAKILGAYLRDLRTERGFKIKDVAPEIRASVSKISRLERGESPPRQQDVLDLVRSYGVTSDRDLAEVQELLRQATAPAWWDQYADVMPGWLKRLIGLEDSAELLRTYELHTVPGLLQTPDYARAVVRAGLPDIRADLIERRVSLRRARQQLLDSESRPSVVALLDESILHRPLGGPEVMVEQLRYLRSLDRRRGINVRIVPFAASAEVAPPPSSITHLKFAAGGPAEVVYLEQIDSATYLVKDSEVQTYRYVLDRLSGVAARRLGSLALLDEAIERFSRQIS